jgi:DNA-binding winged helix-turn-helix (wHTH) protein
MKTSLYLTDRFYVDEWLVEPELGRLSKDGETRQLEPKIMQVLVRLAENNGSVVRKEEFLADIWEGVNVTQHVLTRTISEIRRVVGDDPQNPQFIQTVPKIGYRMIAKISESSYERQGVVRNPDYQATRAASVTIRSNPALLYFVGGILTVIFGFAVLFSFILVMHRVGNPHN